MARSNAKVVPESAQALYELKYEIAAELGLPVNKPPAQSFNTEFGSELGEAGSYTGYIQKDYWGHLASREAGAVGGHITSRLIQRAQETLLTLE
ncbi:small, acid-soluble spore protein, alpha/beta type [Marinicrinis lubricantis]|uniref:Small, acid-soluble spore protein, alpha/beta type n=1 Tax=Marinicrinis lubricantis TaxID=2086470 RepID=A0ABW1IKF5_9BACL